VIEEGREGTDIFLAENSPGKNIWIGEKSGSGRLMRFSEIPLPPEFLFFLHFFRKKEEKSPERAPGRYA
jgi:hypothetical protein